MAEEDLTSVEVWTRLLSADVSSDEDGEVPEAPSSQDDPPVDPDEPLNPA